VAISRIESKLLEPLSVNVKEGAPAANGHEGRSRRPGFGEGGGNRTRGYITYPKKKFLAGGLRRPNESCAMRLRAWSEEAPGLPLSSEIGLP
jgi:hypothetical protein